VFFIAGLYSPSRHRTVNAQMTEDRGAFKSNQAILCRFRRFVISRYRRSEVPAAQACVPLHEPLLAMDSFIFASIREPTSHSECSREDTGCRRRHRCKEAAAYRKIVIPSNAAHHRTTFYESGGDLTLSSWVPDSRCRTSIRCARDRSRFVVTAFPTSPGPSQRLRRQEFFRQCFPAFVFCSPRSSCASRY